MIAESLLPLVWAGIIGFAVAMYVVMDGFDLGIGLLFPFAPTHEDRDTMMSSVAPIWDGNETWLVLGGSALLGAFPLAYAAVLPALYLPIILMLLGLVFRGVAFEFRFKAAQGRRWWDLAFCLGSAAATFSQGVVLGTFVEGIALQDGRFAGGAFDWVSPFALFCGAALLAGYGLLGCGWIILKAHGALQEWARRVGVALLLAVLAAILVVSVWTPLFEPAIAARWFSWPNLLYLSPVPLATGALALGTFLAMRRRHEWRPFAFAVGLFLLSYAGLAISIYPNIVPPELTIWEAAAPEATQRFLLYGTAPIVPLILAYSAYSYYVFRGKVVPGEAYH